MAEKFELFWGGPFSQWAKAKMYDIHTGMTFNCCEQYMMYRKAELFDDTEAMEDVMKTHDPRTQKMIGRKVKGFDKEVWEKSCRQIVEYANYMKFTQNRDMFKALMDVDHDAVFVEASPFDAIWGIGLSEDDPACLDREEWEGTNWLGQAITDVRDDLLEQLHYWYTGTESK